MSSLKNLESEYWRSIEQWVDDPAPQEQVSAEFPMLAEAIARHDRRSFMRLLSASMALAGLTATGCRRWPVEELRPHTSRPEGTSPGIAEHYATLFELGGAAYGVLAKSYDGRPIKIEGNPSHRASLGAASTWAQAHLLDLYDPDRSRRIHHRTGAAVKPLESAEVTVASGTISSEEIERAWNPAAPQVNWEQFVASTQGVFAAHRQRQGEGLAVLVCPSSSPTEQRLIQKLRQDLPKSRWFAYQPLHRDSLWAAGRQVFQQPVRTHYDLAAADYIVCVESDLLGTEPGHLKHARDWSRGRRSVDQGQMNRLVSLESTWTTTGSVADVRIPLRPSQCELAVAWIAARLGVAPELAVMLEPELQGKLDVIADHLIQAGERGLIAGGPSLSTTANEWIHRINARLQNTNNCIAYSEEPLAELAAQGYLASIRELSELLQGNVIRSLVILGGNPVYDAPADAPLDLTSTEQRPLLSIHLSSYDNETSRLCSWHLPLAHGLECWTDGLSWDGTYTLGQPLIEPIFGGKSTIEMLGLLAGVDPVDARTELRTTFDKFFADAGNLGWERALHDGCFGEAQLAGVNASGAASTNDWSEHLENLQATADDKLELRLFTDNCVIDGRFANNAWLQELPDPLTKLTWDNAALIAKADADRLGISNGSIIRLMDQIEIPAMIMPGQAVGCIAVAVGYGRQQAGRIGNAVGSDVYPLRNSTVSYVIPDCSVDPTGRHHDLATTQLHHVLPSIADVALKQRLGEKGQAGQLVHEASLEDFLHDPHAVHGDQHAVHAAPLFNQPDDFGTPHRWAMAIDLNACIGCNGCVVACQAENNIPVVGKQNVLANREMHWIRVDRYFKGDIADPDVVHVPTACAHCENAPCEQVCPVAATVHDTEGINAMVYNRCIGTRYCANNCPYKVRRFNFFDFHASDPREPSKPYLGIPDAQQEQEVSTLKKMVHNPEVTVRMRGVMEKCTYCVQRISHARINAKNEAAQGLRGSDTVQEGELQTACQATCPTQAIVFGDLNDPESAVSKARANGRSYEMLAELNLGARTTYLAKVRNRPS